MKQKVLCLELLNVSDEDIRKIGKFINELLKPENRKTMWMVSNIKIQLEKDGIYALKIKR